MIGHKLSTGPYYNVRNIPAFQIFQSADRFHLLFRTYALKIKIKTVNDQRAILSFDISSDGTCIAAGTELKGDAAHIVFWCVRSSLYRCKRLDTIDRDVRNSSAPTHVNESAHSDDITAAHFHSRTPHLLLTASTDGLLCTIDVREQDEIESGIQVGNWGCSVNSVGWTDSVLGGGKPMASSRVWAHSDMQTVSLWSDEVGSFDVAMKRSVHEY